MKNNILKKTRKTLSIVLMAVIMVASMNYGSVVVAKDDNETPSEGDVTLNTGSSSYTNSQLYVGMILNNGDVIYGMTDWSDRIIYEYPVNNEIGQSAQFGDGSKSGYPSSMTVGSFQTGSSSVTKWKISSFGGISKWNYRNLCRLVPVGFDVSLSGGTGMTCSSGGNSYSASTVTSSISITFNASTGYYFPTSYSGWSSNGLTLSRLSNTQVRVSGTPNGIVSQSIPAATKIPSTVTFNPGAASGSAYTQNFTYGNAQNLTANKFSYTGYTFKGWDTSSSATTVRYNNSASFTSNNTTVNGTTNLYAVWEKTQYGITYILNNGAVSGTNPTSYYIDTSAITLINPIRTGYTFDGWSGTGLTGTTNQIVTIPVGSTEAKTYTANWTPYTYSIRFDGNGALDGSMGDLDMTYGVAKNLTANGYERKGYTFKGWSTSADSTTVSKNDGVSVSNLTTTDKAIVTYYAVWDKDSYPIGYTLNGGKVDGTNPTSYSVDTETFTLINPTRTGYTFKGWSGTGLTDDENKEVTIEVDSVGNRSFTANWTANTYHITYDVDGGQVEDTGKNVTYDKKYGTLPTPAKNGNVFIGWYTESTSGTQITADSIVKIIENSTLYAHYLAAPSTIKTDANGKIDDLTDLTEAQIQAKKDLVEEVADAAQDKIDNGDDKVTVLTELTEAVDQILADATLINNQNIAKKALETYAETEKAKLNDMNLKDSEKTEFEAFIDFALTTGESGIEETTSDADTDTELEAAEDNIDTVILAALARAAVNDEAEADLVTAKIEAIGAVEYTSASKDKIDEARSAYDSLTDAQNAYIEADTLKILTDAEDQYKTVDQTVAAINDIGTVVCTNACKAKITYARARYNILSATNKSIVPASVYKVLTDAEAKMVELEAKKGEVVIDVVVSETAPKTELKTDKTKLENIVLTEEEKELVNHGQKATIYLEIKDEESKIDDSDKAVIEKLLEDNQKAVYLDVTLWKQVGSEEPERVTETEGKIKVSIKLAKEFININDKVSRTYSVIRVHDGVATTIEGEYDEATETFTFETDRFSTYSLVYTDTAIKEPEPEKAPETTNTTKAPKTGDMNPIGLVAIILAISACGIIIVATKRKKETEHNSKTSN